ncbi:hypothetical protein [Nitrosospira sp. Nsp13]|uniref:hypothetical protein n=1 Tax=Nitrosospira sp. Nsp13 TaxID=1855332 RepID=UPI0008853C32|nr:hypothetical protein [Nitrosospira sp. Nsp13]SCY58150.1 hypothetical protein SAMN05216308_12023 [Nitrosospira sp. Nsp13]
MLPPYLKINEAVARISEKKDERFSLEWLLQHAHSGRIKLFALVRQPIFLEEIQVVDIDYVFSRGKKGIIYRSDPLRKPYAIYDNPSPQLSPTKPTSPLPSNIITTPYAGECRFKIADYVPLTIPVVGQLLASPANPRTITLYSMPIKGEQKRICTAQQLSPGSDEIPRGLSSGWWITENDLYVETGVIELLLNSPQKKIERTGLTIEEILAFDWPVRYINLRSALQHCPKWIRPARTDNDSNGKEPSRWNPVKLAICLMTPTSHKSWMVKQGALEALICDKFPEWIDEWNAAIAEF